MRACFRSCLGPISLREHSGHGAKCDLVPRHGVVSIALHRPKRRRSDLILVPYSRRISRPPKLGKRLRPAFCAAAYGDTPPSEQPLGDASEISHMLRSSQERQGDEPKSFWTHESGRDETDEDLAGVVPAGGLMTDSVLELKWKAEARREVLGARTGDRAASCGCDEGDESMQIRPIEDPARFYAFTRIAAPTALLGRPARADLEEPEAVLQRAAIYDRELVPFRPETLPVPYIEGTDIAEDSSDVPPSSIADAVQTVPEEVDPQSFHPYAVAALAQRMLHRVRAKKVQEEFIHHFQGEFDNFEQISEQRAAGIFPREGGGHEHIHCSLTALQDDMLFARYYFNGNPAVVFRSRLYRVVASDASDRGIVEMRIFRFYEETERRLKASNYDISSIEWSDEDMYDWLQGCEVFWERYEPPAGGDDRAARELGISSGARFVGYMKGGGCELYSREIAGRIRVMDDLLLTAEDLWVSDRGFDAAGHFVYGNRKGVPYKMKRVHPEGPAAWTLLSSTPAPEGYQP
jgi:hypothetical protein